MRSLAAVGAVVISLGFSACESTGAAPIEPEIGGAPATGGGGDSGAAGDTGEGGAAGGAAGNDDR